MATEISQEHKNMMAACRDKWQTLMKDPKSDRAKANSAIAAMYQLCCLQPPKAIIWCGSPASMLLIKALSVLLIGAKDSIRKSVAEGKTGSSIFGDVFRGPIPRGGETIDDERDEDEDESATQQPEAFDVKIPEDDSPCGLSAAVWKSVFEHVQAALNVPGVATMEHFLFSMPVRVRTQMHAKLFHALPAHLPLAMRSEIAKHKSSETLDQLFRFISDTAAHASQVVQNLGYAGQDEVSLWLQGAVSELHKEVRRIHKHLISGQPDSLVFAVYDMYMELTKLDECRPTFEILKDFVTNVGMFIPGPDICWVCDRLERFSLNREGFVHADMGPAVRYPDGWASWVMNRVVVPRWLAETRDTELDPRLLVVLRNAEWRREFVRKIGIDRICYKLGAKVVDKEEPMYELLQLEVGNGRTWTYLKMENASLPGTWHAEGVPNETKTVREAIMFRNGLSEDQIDEEHGSEYFQQGDVLLFPRGATKFKSRPKILT